MTYPLALRMIEGDVRSSTERIAQAANDPSLKWEDVSRIAGEENLRILGLMGRADQTVSDFVEANTDHALRVGITMFNRAVKDADPDFVPDLAEGICVLVSRVRRQAEEGKILPMNYMEPAVRKLIFLVESYNRSVSATRVAEHPTNMNSSPDSSQLQ